MRACPSNMMSVHVVCVHVCMLYVCLCVVSVVYMHWCKYLVRAGPCNYVDVPQFCQLSLLLGEGSLERLEGSPATAPTVDNKGRLHRATTSQHRDTTLTIQATTQYQKGSDNQLLASYVIQHPSTLWLLRSNFLQMQQCICVHLDKFLQYTVFTPLQHH